MTPEEAMGLIDRCTDMEERLPLMAYRALRLCVENIIHEAVAAERERIRSAFRRAGSTGDLVDMVTDFMSGDEL